MSFHHNLRIRQIGEVEGAAAMVGVSVRVNQVIEPKAVIGGNRDIAAGVFFQRIEQYCVPRPLTGQQIGFALTPVQFSAKHEMLLRLREDSRKPRVAA
jgi:hypothetical protein